MKKITLAADWTDPKGKAHKADSTVEVDELVGRELILLGLAREADTKATKEG